MNLNLIKNLLPRTGTTIFVIALLFRLSFFVCLFPISGVTNDTPRFHNPAVNLVSGNGYSEDTNAPYKPFFFREPGYAAFLAIIYWVYSFFDELHYIESIIDLDIINDAPETVIAQIVQVILGSLTCLLFYKTLRLVLNNHYAFVIAFFFAIYQPTAVYSLKIMRETLQAFVVMSLAFTFSKFYLTHQYKWLISFSILWAISNLILQVTALLFGMIFIFTLFQFKDLKKSVLSTCASTGIMLLVVSPWIMRSYQFYPDIRVAKTFGSSFTHEMKKYCITYRHWGKMGALSWEDAYRIGKGATYLPAEKQFEYSFNGYFDKLLEEADLPVIPLKVRLIDYIKHFRTGWVECLWNPIELNVYGNLRIEAINIIQAYRYHGWWRFIFTLPGFVLGLSAFVGTMLFYKRLFPILLIFTYFFPLLAFIGLEPRRAYLIHPFILMFGILTLMFAYIKLVKKKNLDDFFNDILIQKTPKKEC